MTHANNQQGFSIPAAIFVLVVVALLGAAMVNILNRGQESVAREVLSIRALMAAESGAERALNQVLENGVTCALHAPGNFTALFSWAMTAPGMQGCDVTVSCGRVNVDADSNGSNEDYVTIRSVGECGPGGDRAHRIVQVQARL